MKKSRPNNNPFNSPLESGIRSLAILVELFPNSFDLQHLVVFDHLVVHTGDLNGPTSLHPKVPMRSGELLVRRGIVERGLSLMISKNLIEKEANKTGIVYRAGEFSETFLSSLKSEYLVKLRQRAKWVADVFGDKSEEEIRETVRLVFDNWLEEFQSIEIPIGAIK